MPVKCWGLVPWFWYRCRSTRRSYKLLPLRSLSCGDDNNDGLIAQTPTTTTTYTLYIYKCGEKIKRNTYSRKISNSEKNSKTKEINVVRLYTIHCTHKFILTYTHNTSCHRSAILKINYKKRWKKPYVIKASKFSYLTDNCLLLFSPVIFQGNPEGTPIPIPSDSPDTCISLAKCICKQSGFTFGYHGGNRYKKHRKNQNQTEDKQPRMTDSHIH